MQYSAKEIWKVNPYSLNGLFFALWILSMMAVPIGLWVFNHSSISNTMIWGVITQTILLSALLTKAIGPQQTMRILFAVGFLGWLAEYVGTQTGLPFGVYHYTDQLQPQIGHVPLLIPLAWYMMIPVSWGIVQEILATSRLFRRLDPATMKLRYNLIFASLSALCMTAWDLFLDPQMVHWGFWVWESPGPFSYFGIPWSNYLGWLIVTFLMTVLIQPPNLREVFPHLWLIYAIVWFLETFGLMLFWNLYGPAIIGSIGMGVFLAWPLAIQLIQSDLPWSGIRIIRPLRDQRGKV